MRWWVAAIVAVRLLVAALVWWRPVRVGAYSLRWLAGSTTSLLVLLGVLVVTAWLPEGSTRGVVMLGQSTARVLAACTALAIALAGVALLRMRAAPFAGKWAIGLLTLYGVGSCVAAIAADTPYPALFQGESVWRRLPFWLQGAVIGALLVVPAGLLTHVAAAVMRVPGRARFQQMVALAMSLVMMASGFLAPAGQPLALVLDPRPIPSREVLAADIETIRAATAPQHASEMLDAIQRTDLKALRPTFDVQAKAAQLGRHVNRMFAFVRDEVRYEVYDGVLRGGRGALMAGAGNSFDKSLLLGSLLKHHGFTVRFAHGRLPQQRADALVRHMFASAQRRPARAPDASVQLPMRARDAAERLTRVIDARWRTNLELVENALQRAGLQPADAPPVSRDVLLAEAANHLWIEYREGDRWVPLDASFSEAEPGETYATASDTLQDVPRALAHRVTLRVRVEERDGGKLITREVLRHEAMAAQLSGALVTIGHRLARDGKAWSATPVLQIDNRTISGQPFPTGTSGSRSPLGGFGEAFGRMTDFLGEGTPPAIREVAAVWLEFDFTSPAGQSETVRRAVVDRIGPVARAQKQEASAPLATLTLHNGLPLALAGFFACSFSAGTIAPGLMLGRLSAQVDRLRSSMPRLAENRTLTDAEERQLVTALAPAAPALLATLAASVHLVSQQSRRLFRNADLLFYEASPRLAIASTELIAAGDGKTVDGNISIDLRRNNLRVASERLPGRQIVQASIARGVLDGAIEHALFADTGAPARGGAVPPGSTVNVMEHAVASRTPLTTVHTLDGLGTVEAPSAVKARMAGMLGEEIALVAPTRPVGADNTPGFGWWRVDLRSGETLAVMDSGLHQLVERLATVYMALYIGFGVGALGVKLVRAFWIFCYNMAILEQQLFDKL